MTLSSQLKKGDEVCVALVGVVESFVFYPGNDVVATIVDDEGNMHSLQLKSPYLSITKLTI